MSEKHLLHVCDGSKCRFMNCTVDTSRYGSMLIDPNGVVVHECGSEYIRCGLDSEYYKRGFGYVQYYYCVCCQQTINCRVLSEA